MPQRPALIYVYDGSFEGLLCCAAESLRQDEVPLDVLPEGGALPLLLPMKSVETDAAVYARVRASIPRKMGYAAWDFLRRAFLTCMEQKELRMLLFLHAGFAYGPAVMHRLADAELAPLFAAVGHLENEAHLYKGFVRFSEANGALTAAIEPKNFVLPLIARHFCERYPCEQFLVHDRTHGCALVHQKGRWAIVPVEELMLPAPGEEERAFRTLWQLYYDTIEIKQRHNPRCRMSFVPKRYWHCMTEFARGDASPQTPALPAHAPSLPPPGE